MPTITADKIIGHNIYAKTKIDAYNYPDKPNKIVRSFKPGELIGLVYSYIEKSDGVYWMIQVNNQNLYVKHITGALDVKELPSILEEIKKKEEEKKLQEQGPIAYYTKKYLPWIIGAVALSFIIPAIRKK